LTITSKAATPPAISVPAASSEVTALIDRRRAEKLGFAPAVTFQQAADYLGISRGKIERLARAGKIPAHRACRVPTLTWMFLRGELDSWLGGKIRDGR
jgi:excisionase family DNA binding protein